MADTMRDCIESEDNRRLIEVLENRENLVLVKCRSSLLTDFNPEEKIKSLQVGILVAMALKRLCQYMNMFCFLIGALFWCFYNRNQYYL